MDGSMWSLDEQALDVVAVVVWGVLNGDLCAVYVGAVSGAVALSSKGDCCGLCIGGGLGFDGTYVGGGVGGSLRALQQVLGLGWAWVWVCGFVLVTQGLGWMLGMPLVCGLADGVFELCLW